MIHGLRIFASFVLYFAFGYAVGTLLSIGLYLLTYQLLKE